jgi:hypothetical protein
MNKNYVIRWKSKINGRTGTGTTLFAKDEARSLAEELNRDYPDFEHDCVNAQSEPDAESPILAGHAAE